MENYRKFSAIGFILVIPKLFEKTYCPPACQLEVGNEIIVNSEF